MRASGTGSPSRVRTRPRIEAVGSSSRSPRSFIPTERVWNEPLLIRCSWIAESRRRVPEGRPSTVRRPLGGRRGPAERRVRRRRPRTRRSKDRSGGSPHRLGQGRSCRRGPRSRPTPSRARATPDRRCRAPRTPACRRQARRYRTPRRWTRRRPGPQDRERPWTSTLGTAALRADASFADRRPSPRPPLLHPEHGDP